VPFSNFQVTARYSYNTPGTIITPSLNRFYNIIRRALEKTRSALANIASIERILIAIYKRRSVRVHILGPASIIIDSRSLSVFLAVWRRGAGHVTRRYSTR
jgi:hypothetical protein